MVVWVKIEIKLRITLFPKALCLPENHHLFFRNISFICEVFQPITLGTYVKVNKIYFRKISNSFSIHILKWRLILNVKMAEKRQKRLRKLF